MLSRFNRIGLLVPLILPPLPAARALQDTPGTALVRHAPSLNGTVEGSIHQMLGENTSLNSGAVVTGNLLVPGTPVIRLNGMPVYGGTLDGSGDPSPASHQVTLNGNVRLGHVVRRTDAISMPAFSPPPAPEGTRSVTIDSPDQTAGDFATLRNLTVTGNAGQYAVPPGTYGNFAASGDSGLILGVPGATQPGVYHFQRLTLDGQAQLRVVGPVVITVASGVTANHRVGSSAHVEWLTLNIHSGGLTLNGGASFHGSVNAPNGTVAINGNGRLIGCVASDRLTLNGGLLRLLAPLDSNVPPSVVLIAPPDGSLYNGPTTIDFSAEAADVDGTIARVEFHQGGVKVGETTTAPHDFSWTDVPPGSYSLTAVAFDNLGAGTASPASHVTVNAVVPYFTGFEPADGFAAGPVSGQGGWTAGDGAAVTDLLSFSGTQSVLLAASEPPAHASITFTATGDHAIVFADIFARPVAGAAPAASTLIQTGFAQITCVRAGLSGDVLTLDGVGKWQSTGFKIPLSNDGEAMEWVRFTVREDFVTKTWDLYANGRLIAFDQGFADATATAFSGFWLVGAPVGSTTIDDFFAGFDNPLFIDVDRDGMEDEWENTHGLDPASNDRNADRDGDGLSNIREYLLGLNPEKASTFDDGIPDALRVSLGLSLTGPTVDTMPPTMPADITAIATGQNVALIWSASTDNIGVAGYVVSRDNELLRPDVIGATTFADVVPNQGASYTYAVSAFDFAGNQSAPGLVQVEVPAPDTDGNGLPDEWEWSQFGSLGMDPDADPDGDGFTNLAEFQNATDPTDFFNGVMPILDAPNGELPAPGGVLELRVLKPDGTPWANAPVTFEITSGYNRLSTAPDASIFRPWVQVRSDSNGMARAYIEDRQ